MRENHSLLSPVRLWSEAFWICSNLSSKPQIGPARDSQSKPDLPSGCASTSPCPEVQVSLDRREEAAPKNSLAKYNFSSHLYHNHPQINHHDNSIAAFTAIASLSTSSN